MHAFYNALSSEALSLSMRCTLAPFELDGKRYPPLEAAITADAVADLPSSEQRAAAVLSAVRAQYASEAAEGSGLAAHLLATGDKLLACVDLNPWLGIQARGGRGGGGAGREDPRPLRAPRRATASRRARTGSARR